MPLRSEEYFPLIETLIDLHVAISGSVPAHFTLSLGPPFVMRGQDARMHRPGGHAAWSGIASHDNIYSSPD